MKFFAVILFALAPLVAIAQTKTPVMEKQIPKPDYFIDSIKINDDYLKYMNPDEIESINVVKNAAAGNGAIFITLKNHDLARKISTDKLLSVKDIWKANIAPADRHKKVLYMIDDKLLTDTTNVRIPSMFVRTVSLTKATEMPYFNTVFPQVLLIKISTKPPVVYIRGQAASK